MIIHDISVTTTPQTVTWDGIEQGFSHVWTSTIGPESIANVSLITIGTHTGTHLDAPLHFVKNGKMLETLDVNVLVGPAVVMEVLNRPTITLDDLVSQNLPADTERVIFKTDNTTRRLLSDLEFHSDYVGLDPNAAQWLVDKGVKLVGIDYLSIGPYGDANTETHQILLGAGVVIVETLTLEAIRPGAYTLIALPPKFAGLEGSPCRVLLVEGDWP